MKNLKDYNIIETSQGTKGAKLARNSKDITMLEVYNAINQAPLFNTHFKERSECEISNSVEHVICELTNEAQSQMELVLSKKSLRQLISEVRNKISKENDVL